MNNADFGGKVRVGLAVFGVFSREMFNRLKRMFRLAFLPV